MNLLYPIMDVFSSVDYTIKGDKMAASTRVKRIGFWGIAALVVIQVYRPAKTNPPIDPKKEVAANLAMDPAAGALLARACNDCHSNRTVWPWYSNVAPVS